MVQKPVTPGETHVLVITELGAEGDGIGYVDDFTVVVDGATLGETVRVEITEVGPTFARGEVVDSEFGFD
ncbi:TRAM domain-containing protein [Haloplanus sp.]|uniref:TRAM domain-containing protein n=1 Tax=Haloplanus sp. TaxID=1961696 RepID=UPI002605C185|nr:TRAM domain-containing protein [Haloplanus sp.]